MVVHGDGVNHAPPFNFWSRGLTHALPKHV